MIISVDFDGTITKERKDNLLPGTLQPEAAAAINWLKNEGHTIIVNSCRSTEEIKQYLKHHDIRVNYINENAKEHLINFPNDCRKIYADLYIDDKSAGTYGYIDWEKVKKITVKHRNKTDKFSACPICGIMRKNGHDCTICGGKAK